MNKAKQKGYRTVAHGRRILEKRGYIVRNVEKSGKFAIEKDLFGLWDVLAIKGQKHLFIQFKTNMGLGIKKPQKWVLPYIEFGRLHGSDYVKYEIWNKRDRKGFQIKECR